MSLNHNTDDLRERWTIRRQETLGDVPTIKEIEVNGKTTEELQQLLNSAQLRLEEIKLDQREHAIMRDTMPVAHFEERKEDLAQNYQSCLSYIKSLQIAVGRGQVRDRRALLSDGIVIPLSDKNASPVTHNMEALLRAKVKSLGSQIEEQCRTISERNKTIEQLNSRIHTLATSPNKQVAELKANLTTAIEERDAYQAELAEGSKLSVVERKLVDIFRAGRWPDLLLFIGKAMKKMTVDD